VTPEDLGPLLDALQAKMTFAHTVDLETHSPIPNLDPKLIVVLG